VNVLVTGGAGYIGSHTCKALHAHGLKPVVYDNLSLGRADFVRWGPLVEGDTRDADAVAAALKTHDINAVIHFAALSSVGESISEPAAYYQNNVGGILGLLAGMRQAGCSTIIFSSTAAVYGEPRDVPIAETAATEPVNGYGRSKLMCEQILGDFDRAYGIKSVNLRYFNASGADAEAEIGEYREAETHLIPRAMMALQGYIDDFQVFGADFPTPDGTAIRDYIHVSDLAQAHALALEMVLRERESATFNLGTGGGYSVGEVLSEIGRVSGRRMTPPKGERRPGDPVRLIADARRAMDHLKFAPRQSDLSTIIQTAWRWHQRAHPLHNSAQNASDARGRAPA
jgi:UDP-glucose-4-epimerase GalE